MEAKHTPGSWSWAHRRNAEGMYSTEVFCEAGKPIASVAWYPRPLEGGVTATYRDDNARLIAAAPDLLAALQNIIKDDRASLDPDDYVAALTAIAKAING